jgi:NTE family protein
LSEKTVALVLGSGGARGMAHVGVIRALRARGHEIRVIAGSSIGALVGAVYALGKIDEFTEWISAIRRRDILMLLDVSFRGEGLVKGDKVIDRLRGFFGEAYIEDLPVAFTAVAADIRKGREVWIDSGPLFDAVRASISLPLFFTPYPHKGAKLFDGGLLNPVPVAPTMRHATDLTVAVNLGGTPDRHRQPEMSESEPADDADRNALHKKITDFVETLKDGLPNLSPSESAFFDIMQSSFDAMQGTLARHQLAAYRPDVEIRIPRDACTLLEFDRAAELIALGQDAAERALSEASAA